MKANTDIYVLAARLIERLVRITVSHPWSTLVVACALTGLLGYWGFSIPLRTNIEDLFPETTPHVVRAKATRERLASSTQILMVVVSPDRDANVRFLSDVDERLRGNPLIDSTEYRRDISFFKKNALLFLSEEELQKLDRKLKKAIRNAVEKDLGPFDEEEEAGAGGAETGGKGLPSGALAEKGPGAADAQDDDLVEDFGTPQAKPAAEAGDLVEDFGAPEAKPAAEAGDLVEDFGAAEAKPVPDEEEAGEEGEEEEGSFEVPTEKEIKKKYRIASLSEHEANPEGTVIAMRIFPTFAPAEVARSRELIRLIRRTIKEMDPKSYNAEMQWTMEGDYHKKIEETDILYHDLFVSTFTALGLILLLLVAFFRSIRIVVLTFVPLSAGLAWTLGYAYAAMGYLNLVTAFIFGVLSGLGVEYSMHVAERYVGERALGKPPGQAAVDTLVRLSRAMFGSAVMTSCGFLALMIFDFRGFSQFGAIAGVGIPLCLLVVYVFFPPLVVLLHRFWPEKEHKARTESQHATSLFGTPRRAAAGIAGVLIAAAVMLPGLARVGFEPDMQKVMTPSCEAQRTKIMDRYKKEVSSSSASPIALLTDSLQETETVHRYLDANKENYAHLQTVSSVFSFVPEDQHRKLATIKDMRERLQRKLGALKGKDLDDATAALEYLEPAAFSVSDLPPWVKEKFTDRDGRFGAFVILTAWGNKANAIRVGEITSELDDIQIDGKVYHTSASYYILKDVYDIVRFEGPLALLLAALGALLTVLLDFRSLGRAVAAFAPVLLGVGCFVGLMGWSGENFNMFNMIILPSIFGTSIDTCTHILHRLRAEGPERIAAIANTTGAATFLGAAANSLGFGSLLYATNPGLANIGRLAPVGLLLCWLICLVLTCSWGYLRERQRQSRAR